MLGLHAPRRAASMLTSCLRTAALLANLSFGLQERQQVADQIVLLCFRVFFVAERASLSFASQDLHPFEIFGWKPQ